MTKDKPKDEPQKSPKPGQHRKEPAAQEPPAAQQPEPASQAAPVVPAPEFEDIEPQIQELTADLQRLRADFENYRKRAESEKDNLRELTKAATVMKLLPVIDNIDRAVAHIPAELAGNSWAQGVASLVKSLDKSLADLGLVRIKADPGTPFDPSLHEAIAMEDGDGEQEVITQELRAGYMLGGQIVRPSMVRVGHE